MSHLDVRTRLEHMRDAADQALKFSMGRSRADLDSDLMLALALVRLLEIIGEAAKSVDEATRQAHPQVPWKVIAGTRDRLIHNYFDVNYDIVWAILTTDLPPLLRELNALLSADNSKGTPTP